MEVKKRVFIQSLKFQPPSKFPLITSCHLNFCHSLKLIIRVGLFVIKGHAWLIFISQALSIHSIFILSGINCSWFTHITSRLAINSEIYWFLYCSKQRYRYLLSISWGRDNVSLSREKGIQNASSISVRLRFF